MGLQIILSLLLLIAKGYDVSAQCRSRVEFSSPPATLSTTSYIQPTGQFVIPAVIKPLIESSPESPTITNSPDFNYYNNNPSIPAPLVIADRDDDTWRQLLYVLIFALGRKYSNGGGLYENYFNEYSGDCGCRGSCGCRGNCRGNCACAVNGNNLGYGDNGSNIGYGGNRDSCGCGTNCGNGACGANRGSPGNYGGSCGCTGNCGNNCDCGGNCGNNCSCGGNCGSNYDGGNGDVCGCGRSGCGGIGGCNNGIFGNDGFNNFNGNGVTYIPYPIVVPMTCGVPNFSNDPNCFSDGGYDMSSTLQGYGGKDNNELNFVILADK